VESATKGVPALGELHQAAQGRATLTGEELPLGFYSMHM
jgi:hypothetical protein